MRNYACIWNLDRCGGIMSKIIRLVHRRAYTSFNYMYRGDIFETRVSFISLRQWPKFLLRFDSCNTFNKIINTFNTKTSTRIASHQRRKQGSQNLYLLRSSRHVSRSGVLLSADDCVMRNVRLTVGSRSSTNCTRP